MWLCRFDMLMKLQAAQVSLVVKERKNIRYYFSPQITLRMFNRIESFSTQQEG